MALSWLRASRPSVLVVDDDPDTCRLYTRGLRAAGLDVEAVASHDSALDMLRRRRFAAVLLDVCLPGRSGLDVLSRVRREPANRAVPILMVTARDNVHTLSEAMGRGASAYITKPLSPTKLARIVLRHLQPGPQRRLHLSGR